MKRSPMTRTMSPARRRSTVRMRALRPLVETRSQGCCEKCGRPLSTGELHHRLRRSQGGKDDASCVMLVHPGCHNQSRESIHDNPASSRGFGWLLYSGQVPDRVPVFYQGRGWVLLAVDGTLTAVVRGAA